MTSRLLFAVETGAVSLPEDGQLLVLGGGADETLFALPRDRTDVVQPFFPDHQAILRAGYAAHLAPEGRYAAAVIRLPRARARGRAWVAAAAAATDGPIFIDGAKTDGVEAMLKDLRNRAQVSAPVSKAHGKFFEVCAWSDLSDWVAQDVVVEGFVTHSGVFSADGIDRGSRLLADAFEGQLKGRVADLGAGWGYLSARAAGESAITELHLVEADAVALECARRNVPDTRAVFHWADATTFQADPFDRIICNPPFHIGRSGDPDLGRAFIAQAARLLTRNGVLWLVANRHLPYEAALADAFADVKDAGGDTGFKLYRAGRPRSRRQR